MLYQPVAYRCGRLLWACFNGRVPIAHARRVARWPSVSEMPGWRVRMVVLPVADRSSGEQVSALVGKALTAWHVPEMADEVDLCARELWGNVVRHTRKPASGADERTALVVVSCRLGELLRVEVSDRDESMPVLRRPVSDLQAFDGTWLPDHVVVSLLESGRGLRMVQRRADALSWRPLVGGGKTVWCEFALDADLGAG